MENLIVNKAIEATQNAEVAFSKFITANDTGKTGGHQAGFHIHKNAWSLFFNSPGEKGTNKDKFLTIKWQDSFETTSRFIYYGVGTRNEYRLTRFGKGFPFLTEENVGDLLVLCKISEAYYLGFVLQTDNDIEGFFSAFNISPNDTNSIIPKITITSPESNLTKCFNEYLSSILEFPGFPPTIEIAEKARWCYMFAFGILSRSVINNPDKEILRWLDTEFDLFKLIENSKYNDKISSPFKSVEELIIFSNTILNRRKSRAGKSLEHHLEKVFNEFKINYSTQVVTEGNKKPDFIFPNGESYLNPSFEDKKLVFLAAKTTCKDRWRQILNEADRVKTKHLFTLQQGVSKNQLSEMYKYNVCLVVPKQYHQKFPIEYRSKILSLKDFLIKVKKTQDILI